MTEKQTKILKAALELFAGEGYHATSTIKVARKAGVSEALIFRHFESKDGLLKAILEEANNKIKAKFADIIFSADPKEVIRKTLELPFNILPAEHEGWRLIYGLRWQTNSYLNDSLESLKLILSNAFKKLKYKNASAETELILMILDGAAAAYLLNPPTNKKEILKSLKEKYQV